MQTYYIYMATNKINGKSYIGQTKDFEHRKKTHIQRRDGYCDPNSIFHKALDKYGADNFEWTILATIPGKELANAFERYFIAVYNTFKPNGYNLTKGGDGGSMWNAIPIVRLTPDGKFIKRYDCAADTIADGFYNGCAIRCCRKPYMEVNGSIFMFEEDYKKYGPRKKAKKPRFDYQKRAIYQCDMDGNLIKKFDRIADAEEELGIGHSHIVGCARGTYKTASGFIFVYPEDFPIKDIESKKKKKAGCKVAKVDKETGEILAIYDRMVDAAKDVGGTHKGIWKAVRGQTKTAYGFKWISQDANIEITA